MAEILKTLSAEQFTLLLYKTYSKLFESNISTVGDFNSFIYHSMVFCMSFFVYRTVSEDFIYMNLFLSCYSFEVQPDSCIL